MNGGCSPTSKGWGTRFERVGEAGWDAFRVSALRWIRVWPTGFVFRCGPHLHVQEPGRDVASPHCGCAPSLTASSPLPVSIPSRWNALGDTLAFS